MGEAFVMESNSCSKEGPDTFFPHTLGADGWRMGDVVPHGGQPGRHPAFSAR